ncbi:TRAP transporter substrate-binding protein [Telmatospirillum sp. J64-1]|uniref:TRAP transporter substrate-binding protein n=1 Tax=Telmatospirillum sp. J64-1 TaxID=2502183 RepID=UPI001C8FA203|nr:TRAP transporter substrate-binding protein [Telmatospirillum sp. J64-1]
MFGSKWFAALGLAALCSLAAHGDALANSKTMKIGNFFPDNHPVNIALRDTFKKEVEERSNGEIKVRLFPNSMLGGEEKLYNAVRGGTIEMAILGNIMENEVDHVGIIQLPFLFKDYAHAQAILNGPIGEKLVADMSTKTGLQPLAYGVQGFRVIASNRTIASMEDFKGLRLRFPGIENMVAIGQSLGANVTPLPITEVFGALEQKVVDGVENPYPNIVASKWYEVVKHVLESNHVFTPNMYLVSDKFWNSLTPEQQEIVRTAARNASDHEWKLLIESEARDKKVLADAGVEIVVPDDAFKQQLVDAVSASYESFYSKRPSAREIVEQIRAEQR